MITATPSIIGDLAVETDGLVKAFGATRAVDGVNLAIPRGSVYGVLGPNGAGKTTTIRILATLLRPDGGSARVLGHDIIREAATVRRLVSLTGQFASVDADLTAEENLLLLGRLLGYSRRRARQRADELLAAFGLTSAARHQAARLSGGMRRKLDLAASIIVAPDLLFLDEPTTGLDPGSRRALWEIVRDIVADGTTVLLTTQYLDEADKLADRIAIIDHGKVIAAGPRGELKGSAGSAGLRIRLLDPADRNRARELIADRQIIASDEPDPAVISARIPVQQRAGAPGEIAARALARLAGAGIGVSDFALGQPSLDEVFLALTGGHPAPAQPGQAQRGQAEPAPAEKEAAR
jgi:ABC-2 type transport system ATP-binding protein